MVDNSCKMTALETRIGYVFKDKSLLVRAITHPSYGDGQKKIEHYQRLEFLGDRVLNLLTACAVFKTQKFDEGQMALKLNALVRKEACADVARDFNMGEALLMSPAEERTGGRDKTSILGDACEALLGAIYIDAGMTAARVFYDRFWSDRVNGTFKSSMKDPKTALQELSVLRKLGLPQYNLVERRGPDHNPYFIVEVSVKNNQSATGEGSSKKEAERGAAKALLVKLVDMKELSER